MHCIDINNFKVVELSKELNLPKIVVAAKIAVWQEAKGDLNKWPSALELNSFKQSSPTNLEVEEGVTSLTNKTSVDDASIATTLGLFMNAIVDAAKDPYISRMNLNQQTAGVAFMLTRAGVELDWIIAFMGQPILKKFVEETQRLEGKFSTKKPGENAYDNIKKSLVGDSPFKDTLRKNNGDITISTATLTEVLDDKKILTPEEQMQILNQFKEWQGKAKELNELIRVGKVDVDGAGGTLIETNLLKNSITNVLRKEAIGNANQMLGLELNSAGEIIETPNRKMIGAYVKNSILSLLGMTQGSFLISTEAMVNSLNTIAAKIGRVNLVHNTGNLEVATKVANELYSASLATTDLFNLPKSEIKRLIYGDTAKLAYGDKDSSKLSMVARIKAAKVNFEDNLLIKSLHYQDARKGLPGRVYMPNNENIKQSRDALYVAWLELLEQDAPLAIDLVKYSYVTSGFNKGVGSFHDHIPIELLKSQKFSEDIAHNKQIYNEDLLSTQPLEKKVLKHLWDNDLVVPTLPLNYFITQKLGAHHLLVPNDTGLDTKVSTDVGFVLTPSAGENYIAGINEKSHIIYKPLIKVAFKLPPEVDPDAETEYRLYELVGYTKEERGAIYVRTNKLGLHSKGRHIKEYSGDGNSSIIPSNNVPEHIQDAIDKHLKPFLNNVEELSAPTQEYVKDEMIIILNEVSSDMEERLNFCLNR